MAADPLLLHGWTGSGPGHWQRWLAAELGGSAVLPELPDDADPDLEVWLGELGRYLPGEGGTVIAHSLGCWLWVHAVRRGLVPSGLRVLLVAPAPPAFIDTQMPRFPSLGWSALGEVATDDAVTVVFSRDDPYLEPDDVTALVAAVPHARELVGAGHINIAAGYGPWPAALAWARGDDQPLIDATAPAP